MKKIIQYTVFPIIMALVSYCWAAFYYLDMNPSHWSDGARFIVYSGIIAGTAIGFLVAKEYEE